MTGATVALVGGGPGVAELLTLRAEGLLDLADAVVVDDGLAALARRFTTASVTTVPEGKPAVAVLLAAHARASRLVVRLYRGDPWLHPAHGAERAALRQAGVPTEAVAGVAVEVAVPALAGVPLHVRHLAVACTLGPVNALPPATDAARTIVVSAGEAVPMVRAVSGAGDGRLPAALIPVADPSRLWRGSLSQAAEAAARSPGPTLLVVGAVCKAAIPSGVAEPGVAAASSRGPVHGTAHPVGQDRS